MSDFPQLADAGLWIPRKQRPPSICQPRNRRHCVGELVQIDGSEHAWFEDHGPSCTLLVFVDDATSRLMHLHFTYSESTFSYFEATRAYLEQHGKPVSFYSDKAGIFRVNQKHAIGGDGYTQFARALFRIEHRGHLHQFEPGERPSGVRQPGAVDRLAKELRLQGISTMAVANAHAPSFPTDYNRRFEKPARNHCKEHRPLCDDEDISLIFILRERRKISHVLTLQYETIYLLADRRATRKLIGKYIEVVEYPDGGVNCAATALPCPMRPASGFQRSVRAPSSTTNLWDMALQVAQLVYAFSVQELIATVGTRISRFTSSLKRVS
jgi:hypothetical protein